MAKAKYPADLKKWSRQDGPVKIYAQNYLQTPAE